MLHDTAATLNHDEAAAPAVRQPSTLSPSGGGSSSVSNNAPGPRSQPAHLRSPYCAVCSMASSAAALASESRWGWEDMREEGT